MCYQKLRNCPLFSNNAIVKVQKRINYGYINPIMVEMGLGLFKIQNNVDRVAGT
jgi:hypothetical protein